MIAAILGVVAAVCGQARADDALDVFRTTTEHYRAAPERAVQALTRADSNMVVRGAAACGRSLSLTGTPSGCSRRDALAGAMMLSDAADEAFGIEAGLGRSLLRAATRLIDQLAWLHVLIHDKRADADLDLAIRDAANGDDRYLAHLLRAGIAERADRLDDAIDEYGRAADAGPYYKSACTGLSRAYVMAGRSGEAADTATRCLRLSLERDQNDPWLTLRFGITPAPMVQWLRAEARR